MPAGRMARRAGEHPDHRAPAARSARRRDARPAGPGRRDLPPHAVRRPRPGARERQTRPARSARAGHRDRQVPDRADDGSGPAPGPQRRQPRHRDGRRAGRRRQAAGGDVDARRVERSATSSCSRSPTTAAVSTRRRSSRGRGRSASRCRIRRSTARALLDLICAPGFSTREETDRASGRGVGMAVVKTHGRGAERAHHAVDDARRGDALRHRAAADAGDHRRARSRTSATARSRCRRGACAR